MDAQTVAHLIELNKNFYSQFANEFSETRSSRQIKLGHILPYLTDAGKILDVGCGNGRLAQRLDRENFHVIYVGVDVAPQLIEMASVRGARLQNVRASFRVADLTEPNWAAALRDFDMVIALAVLHHVPSFEMRAHVLQNIRMTLAPSGRVILTNWKFDENERLRRKIVPWSTLGLDEGALEPGDTLIAWRRGGSGYRYVHLISPDEVERLANELGFKIEKQFYADSGLNLYSILAL